MNDFKPINGNPVSRNSLPTAVQRWLSRALPEGLTLPTTIQVEQAGSMDIRGKWMPFTAVGVYHHSPLSFNWQARLQMLPGVWIVAEDGHRAGQGWGGAKLWGLIPMGKRTDPEVLLTQWVRNLAELAWLPSFALTESGLTWTGSGDAAFAMRGSSGGQEATVHFELNDQADIVRASSPARPFDVPGGYQEAPWYYEFSDHRTIDGVRVPGTAVATFAKSDGSWTYFRGNVTALKVGER